MEYPQIVCDLVRTHNFMDVILELNGFDYEDVRNYRKQDNILFQELYKILTYAVCTVDKVGKVTTLEEYFSNILECNDSESTEVKCINIVKEDLERVRFSIEY